MNGRLVAFIFLGLILVIAAEWDLRERVFEPARQLDRFWVDFCIGNAKEKVGDPAITMVRITEEYEPVPVDETLPQSGNAPGSLTRLDYAAILYAVGKMNPKSVSFMPSPVFEAKSVLNATTIYPLKDAALQLPEMALGTVVSGKGEPANSAESVKYPAIQVKGDTSNLPRIARTTQPPDPDILANGKPAFVSGDNFDPLANPSPRVQLVALQGDRVVPGFILSSVVRQAGLNVEEVVLDLEAASPRITVGELYTIPVACDGTMSLPSHAGLSHSMYEVLSTNEKGEEDREYQFASLKVEDVALAAEQSDTVAKTIAEKFAGKFESLSRNLVLIGHDRTDDRTIRTLNDEWLSPMTATARAIATIQSGRHTTRWPVWARAGTYFGIILVGALLLKLGRKRIPLIIGLAVAAIVGMVFVFRETLSWTPPVAIFGLFALLLIIGLFGGGKNSAKSTEEPAVEP